MLVDGIRLWALRDDATTIHVSALAGTGLTTLLERIDRRLEEDPLARVHLKVPQSEGKLLAQIEARARILERAYRDSAVQMEVEAPESLARVLRPFSIHPRA